MSLATLHLKVPKLNSKGPSTMEGLLESLSDIFKDSPTIFSLEIVIQGGFLYFFVICDQEKSDLIRGQFFSSFPNIEVAQTLDYLPKAPHNFSVTSFKLEKNESFGLKTHDQFEEGLITGMSGLAASFPPDAVISLQLVLKTINRNSIKHRLSRSFKESLMGRRKADGGRLYQSLFLCSPRLFVMTQGNPKLISVPVAAMLKKLGGEGFNSLKIRRESRSQASLEEFKKRILSKKNFFLTSRELATIFYLPHTGSSVAQVSVSESKSGEPPISLPTPPEIIPFATTTFRGVQKEFGIKREDRRKHLYIIGKTGVGKSKLIELLSLADIKESKGCVVMDPHGDLVEELLRYIPRNRLFDVVYFNPADTDYPMSFNPLEGVDSFEFRQNVVAGFIAIFKKLFSFTWNQRLEHVLRYTTLALLDTPGATVLGITKMLSDTNYRQEVVAQIKDPLVKKFWTTEFASWNEQFAGEAITPIINKVGQFVANPIIRNIVGQSKSSIKVDEIINGEKILLANFSIGKLGEENSALLGAMFVTKLWQAAMARASVPESERKDTYLYIDEFQNFATSAFANILSEARKYKLNLTLAHQYMAQLPSEVKSTIFGNVGSTVAFRVGGEDAETLEKEYKPTFLSEDFMNLDMRNFYIKMTIDGQTATPFSGRTLDFPAPDEDLFSDAVRVSRERWSRPRQEVEKEIAEQEQSLSSTSRAGREPEGFSEPLL